MRHKLLLGAALSITLMLSTSHKLPAQAQVQAWGNITGMRIDGQLLRFETSLRVVKESWAQELATGKERFPTRYTREGDTQVVRTELDSVFFVERVQTPREGTAAISIDLEIPGDTTLIGAFFHLQLPAKTFSEAQVSMIETADLDLTRYRAQPSSVNEILRAHARGIQLVSKTQQLSITTENPLEIITRLDSVSQDIHIYLTLASGQVVDTQPISRTFTLTIEGTPDTDVAHLTLYPDYPGKEFLGLGGNFRLQNPRNDPQVINYCLENLDVRMGRVELPWENWHPTDTINPLEAARRGEIAPHVKASMEMAQRLAEMGMPVLLAAWFPPQWAAAGEVRRNPRHPDGTFGFPLNQNRTEEIYESLTGYILYLKEAYGVEISMFSFNESDLGINVRQTAEEHTALIKGLGAYMRSKGLDTKLLLGDTADANGYEFVNHALDDPGTWQYIGAISFHSWRGWEKETLLEWFEAADRIDIPLIIGEGSIDAAAWRYPAIFNESHYAMEEIKLYTRILSICQPQAILQWQLTSDYSPLTGGGLFGNDTIPLQPTQRFWNLKQLSETPAGLHAMPITCDRDDINVTALGDTEKGDFVFHLVNESGKREVVINGLPDKVKRFRIYVTDAQRGMEKGKRIKVDKGTVRFELASASFTSLVSE